MDLEKWRFETTQSKTQAYNRGIRNVKEVTPHWVIQGPLETEAAARVKEHAEFIASLEAGMKSHELRLAKQEEGSALLGQRIDQLVLAIGNLISRIPPSALAQ
jgi:hypothetical protein